MILLNLLIHDNTVREVAIAGWLGQSRVLHGVLFTQGGVYMGWCLHTGSVNSKKHNQKGGNSNYINVTIVGIKKLSKDKQILKRFLGFFIHFCPTTPLDTPTSYTTHSLYSDFLISWLEARLVWISVTVLHALEWWVVIPHDLLSQR